MLAQKHGIAQPYVYQILQKGGLKYRKRQKGPKSVNDPTKAHKTRIRRLKGDVFKAETAPDIVMDDESYFAFTGQRCWQTRVFMQEPGML